MSTENKSVVNAKARNKLLKFFTDNEYSHHTVLQIVKHMKGMTDEQKEERSSIILRAIWNCEAEDDAVNILEKHGLLQKDN